MKKLLITLLIFGIIGGGVYYWFYYKNNNNTVDNTEIATDDTTSRRFEPLNRPSTNTNKIETISTSTKNTPVETIKPVVKMPVLRKISVNPIGGYIASSTASSTIIRYIDRGTGHIFETKSDTNTVEKISNTTIARVYESYWNNNAKSAIFRYIKENSNTITNLYGEITPSSNTGTTSDRTPYQTKGIILSSNISEIASSPKGDKIFTLYKEDNGGVGYTSMLNGSKNTKIWNTPLTQLTLDWPEENTLVATTKASGYSFGYSYFIDAKSGVSKKIINQILGLSVKVSPDAKNVLLSSGGNNISSYLYNVKTNSSQSIIFKTLAEKCVWSKIRNSIVYCAVPTDIPQGIYPDDWYKGKISFTDRIWSLNISSGEVHMLADLTSLGKTLIDAMDIKLDSKENYIYFVNKNDLSLWSLDLNL